LGFSDVQQLRQALNTHRESPPTSSIRKVVNKLNAQPKSPEHTYNDSSTFLKGTQSSNPHNDYCQHFVDTGQRPQNFIRDVGLTDRFEEYPKLRELIRLKVYVYILNINICTLCVLGYRLHFITHYPLNNFQLAVSKTFN